MRTRVSLEALVDVARQLEAAAAEAATVAVAMPAAELDAMLRRARALLEQLDRFAQHEGEGLSVRYIYLGRSVPLRRGSP